MTIAKQRNKQSFLRLETRPDDAGFKFVSLKVLQFKVKERCKFLIGSMLKKKKKPLVNRNKTKPKPKKVK